jgi:hypothetical protein
MEDFESNFEMAGYSCHDSSLADRFSFCVQVDHMMSMWMSQDVQLDVQVDGQLDVQ